MAAIIFDFDGTIADSFEFVVDFLARAAKLPALDEQAKQELRGRSMAGIGRSFGLSWWRLAILFFRARRQMRRVIKQVQPFDGMPDAIRTLHTDQHKLFIVTSNSRPTVRAFLREHVLQTEFSKIYGGIGLFGKRPALRRLLREHHITAAEAFYIGDELRDVEAAQSLKLPVIAVTWGFARPADLKALRPTGLADRPAKLLDIIAKR